MCNNINKIKGYNSKNKENVVFPGIILAIKPTPHGSDSPGPPPPVSLDLSSDFQELSVKFCTQTKQLILNQKNSRKMS